MILVLEVVNCILRSCEIEMKAFHIFAIKIVDFFNNKIQNFRRL